MISEYQTYAKPSQDNLVNDHLPLVKRIATHLSVKLPSHIETDDLIQVGLIGLLKAADDYRPDSGAVFSTYATIRIKGAMLDELRSRDWLPRAVQKNLGLVSSAVASVEQRLGRSASSFEVARELGMDLEAYNEMLGELSYARLSSIEDANLIPGDNEPDDIVTQGLKEKAVADAVRELPEKEQLMMSLYYTDNLNLREIGLVLNVSESRVSQIHGQAVARIKSKLRNWI